MLARPGREAARLDHSYIGSDHYLLALLATPSIASETLEELGITYERVVESVRGRETHIAARSDEEPQRRELSPTPDAYGLMGRAEAFAATAGDRRPRPEHWLLAIVWSSTGSSVTTLHHLGAPQPAVLDGLRRRGVPVPEVEPPLYRPWRGGAKSRFPRKNCSRCSTCSGRCIHRDPSGVGASTGHAMNRAARGSLRRMKST
jgi:Clp amino terminal domain, pathogenicity island component